PSNFPRSGRGADVSSAEVRPNRFRLVPMRPRDPEESGRAASSLELFFDLVFVIAVSIAATTLHETVTAGRLGEGLATYLMIFFAIWWAWMNFTWFATSFDTDDWLYPVLTIVQMGGVLILAAGIAPAFSDKDFTFIVSGYVIMIVQWLRAAKAAPEQRSATIAYACGIGLAQVLWVLWLLIDAPVAQAAAFIVLVGLELSIPIFAESRGTTPWHPEHITDRYGCFTIIVLGESLLASSSAVFGALSYVVDLMPLISLGVLSLIVTAAMWWIYFWPPHHRAISGLRGSIKYGYGHYFIFAAAGAFSAGVGIEVDSQLGRSALDPVLATFTVSVPIAVFALGAGLLAIRAIAGGAVNALGPTASVLVLLDPIIPVPTFLPTFFMVISVITLIVCSPKATDGASPAEAAAG